MPNHNAEISSRMSHSIQQNFDQNNDVTRRSDATQNIVPNAANVPAIVVSANVVTASWDADVLARAQMAIATAIFFDDVATSLVAGGIALTNAQHGVLWLRQREFANLTLSLGRSKPEETFEAETEPRWIAILSHISAPDGQTRILWRDKSSSKAATFVHDVGADAEHVLDVELASAVEKAARGEISFENERQIAVPLLKDGVVIAILQLGWRESQHRVLDVGVLDVGALEAFGESGAVGLIKARLFEQIESAKCEWETAFDGMVDGVFIEREDGTVLRANPVAAAFFGSEVPQVIGRTSEELCARLADYQQLRALQPLAGDLSGRDVHTGEFRFGTPARIILETVSSLRLSPYLNQRVSLLTRDDIQRDDIQRDDIQRDDIQRDDNQRDEQRRVVRVLRDITEQRRLGEQLIQSEKLAALGELISGVAHELNNPLTTVTGYAQLLQEDTSLPAHARRQIEHIYEDASRAARIVANLLSFARREETRSDALDINQSLRHLSEMRIYQLQAENVRLTFEYSNDLPLVLGDSHQLQQVFLNIINNAQQALHEWRGGGTIAVETKRVTVGGAPGVLVSFADNGPGIAPDHLRRIFDPFWTTKQDGEGTGLGMSISLDIVSRHGGRIWAESTLGQGARFFIELPGASGESVAQNRAENEIIREADAADEARERENYENDEEGVEGAQILVVDDEEPVILLMSEILRMDDHEITPAFNGGEALALLQERDFDLIISDVRMPAVGGPTFFEILQTARPDLLPRVVFVTGDTMSRSTQDFLKKANRPMLAKPFDPDRLRALVRDQLNRNR